MVRALGALSRGGLGFAPQAADGVTYAKKLDKAETRIDWSRPAAEVHNHIRGLSPDPGAWFEADFGTRAGAHQGAALDAGRGRAAARVRSLGADLTVACGSRRGAAHRGAARRQAAGRRPRRSSRGLRRCRRPSADRAVPRYKLTIEYDGGPFVGWQRQANGPLGPAGDRGGHPRLLAARPWWSRAPGAPTPACTRLGQVAHIDLGTRLAGRQGARRDQRPSPAGAGRDPPAEAVADDFDARFSAVKRHYLYRILDRRPPPVLDRGRVWHVPLAPRHRRDARRGAGARRPPRLHHLPRRRVPGALAGEDARPARRQPRGRRDRGARERPLVPPQPGPLDGRRAEEGRRGPLAGRRGRRGARRPRPHPLRPGRAARRALPGRASTTEARRRRRRRAPASG